MNAANPTAKIVVENLYKVFGSDPGSGIEAAQQDLSKEDIHAQTGQLVAVRDASFSVNEGEIFVVMGLSGSGKSTLVRLLNRLIEPTEGQIVINGQDVTSMRRRTLIDFRRRHISMVFQSFALMPHLTNLDNAAFGLDVAGIDRKERHRRAREALALVGLEHYSNSYPGELSGGMQQRVGLARALALQPSIMLMDEAFSALDPLIRTDMQEELLRVQRERNLTIVFISHDLDEAIHIGDRIAIMDDGAISQIGTADEILAHPADTYVESFFRDVDVSKVLTAGDIARSEQATITRRTNDGVEVALMILRHHNRRYGYVRDRNGHFEGIVSAESLENARQRHAPIKEAFINGADPIPADTMLEDLMGKLATAPCPLAVIDGSGQFSGTISRATLLRALEHSDAKQSGAAAND